MKVATLILAGVVSMISTGCAVSPEVAPQPKQKTPATFAQFHPCQNLTTIEDCEDHLRWLVQQQQNMMRQQQQMSRPRR